ncbi:MAG: biotin--[acetyl-CoA-carboxylase] ligase, partial [Pseudomonadota bacterium]
GRRGTPWEGHPKNLMASRLFPLLKNDPPAAQISFVAAVAMADTVRAVCPGLLPELKWPNDVLIGDAKVCGLLAELIPVEGGEQLVCLGVGLNIARAPKIAGKLTTCLAHEIDGRPPERIEVLEVFEAKFHNFLLKWRADGFLPIAIAWRARAYGIGRKARVVGAGEDVSGVVDGIDEDGGLRLINQSTIVVARAGSLIFEDNVIQ